MVSLDYTFLKLAIHFVNFLTLPYHFVVHCTCSAELLFTAILLHNGECHMFDSETENPDGYFLAVPSTGQVVGHLTDFTKFPKRKASDEPCFVKYYSQAVGALFGVGFTAMKVFMSLAKRMEYADNGQVVFLSPQRRKNIQSELGIGKSSFDKALRTLRDSGLVVRVENNVYVLNPAIVGRGDWNKISNIHTLIDFKNGEIANGFEYDKVDDSMDW